MKDRHNAKATDLTNRRAHFDHVWSVVKTFVGLQLIRSHFIPLDALQTLPQPENPRLRSLVRTPWPCPRPSRHHFPSRRQIPASDALSSSPSPPQQHTCTFALLRGRTYRAERVLARRPALRMQVCRWPSGAPNCDT